MYSNYVNTVFPYHAWEASFGNEDYRLGSTLEIHQQKFGSILKGLDYNVYNLDIDSYISEHYSFKDFELEDHNKQALREYFLLQDKDKLVIAYIGRLNDKKVGHLVYHSIYYRMARVAQFVLLGSATALDINDWLWHEKYHLNG